MLGPLWHETDLTEVGGLVALAYPFGDVVIAFFIVLAVRGVSGHGRLPLWCLLGGLLALAVSDSVYAYLTEVKGYESGQLLDSGWFAGYLAIAVAAFCSDGRSTAGHEAQSSPLRLAPIVAPFLPMLIALSVIGIQIQRGHRPGTVAVIMAFALIVLALARQGLLLVDVVTSNGDREGGPVSRLHGALLDAIRQSTAAESSPPLDRWVQAPSGALQALHGPGPQAVAERPGGPSDRADEHPRASSCLAPQDGPPPGPRTCTYGSWSSSSSQPPRCRSTMHTSSSRS